MDSDAISDISEVTSKSSSKKSRFSRSGKKGKDKSKDSLKKNGQGAVHSVFGRGSKNSSSTHSVSTSNGSTSNPSTSLPSVDDTEVVGSAEDVVAGITGDQEDPAIRFAGEGVTFKAKLIGIDPVSSPRGDAMCKNAMLRLKAIVKGTGAHKKKILLSISLSGLTLMDEKTKETISHHPIPLISYISRDTSDSRAFGFVYGTPHDGHQFIGIKTDKAAIPVMQTIADLFTYVYEKRKKEKSSNNGDQAASSSTNASTATLSFSSKEEFSEQKVNAAWSKSEPNDVTSGNSDDPLGIQVNSSKLPSQLSVKLTGQLNSQFNNSSLPTLLPPPLTAFRAPSSLASDSRTSTLSSIQRSDVLNELRSMRHVINSANAAAASNSSSSGFGSSCDRYATWESFQENDYSELSAPASSAVPSSQAPSANTNLSHSSYESNASGSFTHSMLNRSSGTDTSSTGNFIGASDFSVLENRPSSARSSGLDSLDKASNSSPLSIYSSRLGAGQLRGPSVVSSPPSSPRSTAGSFNSGSSTMSKARARPRRGFEQPNQVALPPPSAFSVTSTRNQPAGAPARIGSFSSTSSSSAAFLAPVTDLPLRPPIASAGALPNSTVPSINNTNLPCASEPDLFASLTFDTLTRDASSGGASVSKGFNKNHDVDKFEANFDAIFPPPLVPPSTSGQQQQQRKLQSHGQLPPPPPPSSHTKQVSFSTLSHASFDSQSNSIFPAADIFDSFNGQKETCKSISNSYASSSSSSSSTNADRYACFKEIQELANIASVFDQTASSGSDSDTFVGSPPSLMSTNETINHNVNAESANSNSTEDATSLFDDKCDKILSDSWNENFNDSLNKESSSSSRSSTTNVPLSSANDEKRVYFVQRQSIDSSTSHGKPERSLSVDKSTVADNATLPKAVETTEATSQKASASESVATALSFNSDESSALEKTRILSSGKFKDTATSPGTPPDLSSLNTASSQDKLHNSQNNHQNSCISDTRSTQDAPEQVNSTDNTLDDPFGMKSLLQDLNRIDLEVSASFQPPTVPQTTNKDADDDTSPDKVKDESKKNEGNNEASERPKKRHSISQTQTSPGPHSVAASAIERPPSTLSSTSSFRNPFTDDDDSEYATSTGATWNPFKHSASNVSTSNTNDTSGSFGQPAAWPSMYDHRVYDHVPQSTPPVMCPSHAYHDQQSHIYFSHAPTPSSAAYVMPPHAPLHPPPPPHPSAAQVCAHGCPCQGYGAPAGAYPCWTAAPPPPPPPHSHAMYCQMHPPGIPGHPIHCVYCRSSAPPYHAHHPLPHPQSQPQQQSRPSGPPPLPAVANVSTSASVAEFASSSTCSATTATDATTSSAPVSTSTNVATQSRSQWPNQTPLGPTEFGSSFDFDDEPLSPPERNIFQHKDDPFADDDFFAQ